MLKKINFLFGMLVLGTLFFSIYFVLAISAPTGVYFEQNTSLDYDKEGIFSVNWTSGSADTENYIIHVSVDGGTTFFMTANNYSATGYSFTNTTDANYTFRIEAANATLDTSNSTDVSIVVDNTNPSISYATGTETDGGGANKTSIFVNVTVSDTNGDSLVFKLYNSTGLVNQTTNAYTISTINWTGLPGGNYTFNVTANDFATNSNVTSTRTFYLDGVAPTIDSFTCTPSSVEEDETVTCSCSGSDGLSGVASTSYDSSPSTSTVGNFSETCTVTDNAGNLVSSSVNYEVTEASTSSSGSGSSGSEESVASSFWISTFLEDDEEFSDKLIINKELAEKYRIRVEVDGEKYYIGVVDLTSTIVTINVSSGTPIQEFLAVGDLKKFDFTEDGYYDIAVILKGINTTSNKADLTFVHVYEEIPAVVSNATTALSLKETVEGEENTGKTLKEKKTQKLVWWILGSVLLISLVLFLPYRHMKEKRLREYGF